MKRRPPRIVKDAAWTLAASATVCSLVLGQSVDSLPALEEEVRKTSAAWQGPARDLNARVARMLPCDPRAAMAIDEVNRASQARLAALARYYQTAEALALTRVEGAKQVLMSEQDRSGDVAAEETQSALADFSAEQQVTDLAESARQHPALAAAQAALSEAREAVRRRAALGKQYAERREPAIAALEKLVAAYEARYDALREMASAFETERARWNEYYAARRARAQTECTITSPAATTPRTAPPKAPQGKAK